MSEAKLFDKQYHDAQDTGDTMSFGGRHRKTNNEFYLSVAPADLKIRANKQVEPHKETPGEMWGYRVETSKGTVNKKHQLW